MIEVGPKGKGGRRYPGRDGGRRKSKKRMASWEKRASHATDSVNLGTPRKKMNFMPRYGSETNDSVYKLDQAFASANIPYSLEPMLNTRRFSVTIEARHEDLALNILQSLVAKY